MRPVVAEYAPRKGAAPRRAARATTPVWLALGVVAAAAMASSVLGSLPASLALSATAMLAAAAVAVLAGASAPPAAFGAVCLAMALAGLPNAAIAFIQVFAPQWPDGDLIAHSSLVGRAVGNLRQPNHLASLLLWSAIAVVALLELGRLRLRGAGLAVALLMGALVLTASRTGTVGAVLLALWALADRRLSRRARGLLLSAPAWYALAWVGMAAWARQAQQVFGGQARLAESVESSSRLAIWRDTLVLIREHPWWGVGFGEFNFAWSLTPLPQRPVAFFDHSHNLPLQLFVELGLPLGTLALALLVFSLLRAAWLVRDGAAQAARLPQAACTARRTALAMVVMIGLHSLLEYPLWYAYFLLPAAWCLGVALAPRPDPLAAPRVEPAGAAAARPDTPRAVTAAGQLPASARGLRAAGALLVVGALAAVADYWRVVPIFEPGPGASPLEARIAEGRRSLLFAHHAHYAAATVTETPAAEMASLQQAAHHLLDTRLMMAWARAYAEAGDLDRARHLAARLREFRNPASQEWFAPCKDPGASALQCQPPPKVLGWQDFKAR